ncbi:hypothetical protein MTR_3g006490 [Medicago truncatula]|uniref:Uncharacterized protein n=1 Tax=Medicago truncatula TaxID=3880 RepID=A0A072V3T3_MEDTR|nr:hypothetical protein MTR_3g006490 [Medicago truncatula]
MNLKFHGPKTIILFNSHLQQRSRPENEPKQLSQLVNYPSIEMNKHDQPEKETFQLRSYKSILKLELCRRVKCPCRVRCPCPYPCFIGQNRNQNVSNNNYHQNQLSGNEDKRDTLQQELQKRELYIREHKSEPIP